jgi:hypothetical protein
MRTASKGDLTPEQSAWEVVVVDDAATIRSPDGRPDVTITADEPTWRRIGGDYERSRPDRRGSIGSICSSAAIVWAVLPW